MAGPYPPQFIESIRDSGDIVQFVSDYVPLKPSGSRLKGLCPFHEEKTPSFSVDPTRQLFYCFGCQTGGDLFKFAMLYEKVAFPEAAEMLAKRFGVPLPKRQERDPDDPLARLYEMNRTAETFFRTMLADGAGSRARAYLKNRKIDDKTAETLRIGYAPDGWDGLRSHLLSKRFKPEEGLTGGLLLPRKSGSGQYDRFRDRLIFPIHDVGGRPIAFGGRILADGEPKYINSPETPIYKKGAHLYGLDQSKEKIRRAGYAIVVEGYMDFAAVVQAGFEHVVASLGTAFTEAQARLLARYANRVVFSYDGDSAGAKATERSLDMLLQKGLEVRVIELAGGADPDDFIREHGAAAYGERLENAPDYIEFLIHRAVRGRDLTKVGEKVAAVQLVLPHLVRLASAIERSAWVNKLADQLGIEEQWILQELGTAVRTSRPQIRERPARPHEPRPVEARLICQLLRSGEERQRLAELDLSILERSEILPIVQAILHLQEQDLPADYPTVLEALADEQHKDLLTRIAFRDEPEEGPDVEDCLWTFRRQHLALEGRKVRREIDHLQQAASASTSPTEIDQQLTRLQQLARQRDALT